MGIEKSHNERNLIFISSTLRNINTSKFSNILDHGSGNHRLQSSLSRIRPIPEHLVLHILIDIELLSQSLQTKFNIKINPISIHLVRQLRLMLLIQDHGKECIAMNTCFHIVNVSGQGCIG